MKYKVTMSNFETGEYKEMILDHNPVQTRAMRHAHAADTINTIAETMNKLTAVMVELSHDAVIDRQLQSMLHGYSRILDHMADDLATEAEIEGRNNLI